MQTKQNENTVIVNLTPHSITTDGYLYIREEEQPAILRFLPNPRFRGRLKSVEWNVQDNVKHTITEEDEDFKWFSQVGSRPEIQCSTEFFDNLDIPNGTTLRIRFEFETFRAEPVWYGFLYIVKAYGDMQADTDAAYKIPRPQSSTTSSSSCENSSCNCDCHTSCDECDEKDHCEYKATDVTVYQNPYPRDPDSNNCCDECDKDDDENNEVEEEEEQEKEENNENDNCDCTEEDTNIISIG